MNSFLAVEIRSQQSACQAPAHSDLYYLCMYVQYIQVRIQSTLEYLVIKCLISSHRYDLPLCILSYNRWNILLHVIVPNGKLQSVLLYVFRLTQDPPFPTPRQSLLLG